ncbi:GNAT family N-acetyltransferase [Nocardioides marmoribigeumensis]|uniref:GNAT superfamily N-acetyltransferase n=1 Tax=Nocardioides marmoribigeumensis TaxID=433649 RepID=A0ABU2C1K1_9ACTN|nr:GNAT family N-acetyltransferase [Nocardioides marmoribigeumensis]MDR7364527.1 GNAT superfamily N-acetyltransferase [Nocardioides marmoribigeumensis]
MDWDDAAVDAAFAEWVWIPEGTQVHEVPGGHLLVRPAYLHHRTFTTGTPPRGQEERAVDAALALVREHGLPSVRWAVGERPENAEFAAALERRGATVFETLDRLAWEPRELPAPRPDVLVLPVRDEVGARALGRVDEVAFGDPPLEEGRIPGLVEECVAELSDRVGARFVAWTDGEGVGTGGLSMAGEVARLWGGATLPHARRRGVYSAVLAERLRVALGWGATLALVKGRIETSAPILRRFGFRPHGREVTYDLPA